MLSHERLTAVMKQSNAKRVEIREALEHHRKEVSRLQSMLVQLEGEFSMCVELMKESALAETPEQPQSVNGQPEPST